MVILVYAYCKGTKSYPAALSWRPAVVCGHCESEVYHALVAPLLRDAIRRGDRFLAGKRPADKFAATLSLLPLTSPPRSGPDDDRWLRPASARASAIPRLRRSSS